MLSDKNIRKAIKQLDEASVNIDERHIYIPIPQKLDRTKYRGKGRPRLIDYMVDMEMLESYVGIFKL